MKIKRINNKICSYCNSIAIAKEESTKNYYCNYHLLKEEISRTIYKIEYLPGITSSFPDYNRDKEDYKRARINNKIKIDREILLAAESISILFLIGNNLEDCIIAITESNLLSISYNGIEYIFSWSDKLDYNKIQEYIGSNKISLAYAKKNNKIVKYY